MSASTAHRPWPVPQRAWTMAMRWHDLLFAHWRIDAAALRPLIPAALDVDTFDGTAWLGVVPFRMTGVRLRGTPALPGPGAFPELNVRTYVRSGDRAGVWFFSLDAASRIAVRAARRLFHLPYFDASVSCRADGDGIAYSSRRTHRGAPPAELVASYGPTGEPFVARPGTLEHWLTERYCLVAATPDGRVRIGEIHHEPWPVQPARAAIDVNTMARAAGLALPDAAPHLLFARRLDVVAWSLDEVGTGALR